MPHGYEGQGPEHSNAYVERFLSLCAENNMQVVIPSTPASYFHVLRRQMNRKFRKPLILMMPKSMLRMGISTIDELIGDSQFQNVIDDPANPSPAAVRRVLLCSGKVYHSLVKARDFEDFLKLDPITPRKDKHADIAIVRVEQPYPFPSREISNVLGKYRNARQVLWVQEEPKNRGCWTFMEPRVRDLLPQGSTLGYCGRDEAASPATGSLKMHNVEEEELLTRALDLSSRKTSAAALASPAVAVAAPAASK